MDFRPEGPEIRPEGPETLDFRPEGPEIRPEGPEMEQSRFWAGPSTSISKRGVEFDLFARVGRRGQSAPRPKILSSPMSVELCVGGVSFRRISAPATGVSAPSVHDRKGRAGLLLPGNPSDMSYVGAPDRVLSKRSCAGGGRQIKVQIGRFWRSKRLPAYRKPIISNLIGF